MGGDLGLHGPYPAEEFVQDVLPVREHVGRDAAAVLGAIVPGRALRRLPVTFEDPIAELAPHGEDAPEETAFDQARSLSRPGRKILSCTTPCLTPASSARRASSSAPSRLVAVGFSQYRCFPAAIAFFTDSSRAPVTWASK